MMYVHVKLRACGFAALVLLILPPTCCDMCIGAAG